jgi:hypothetical protein
MKREVDSATQMLAWVLVALGAVLALGVFCVSLYLRAHLRWV